MKCIYICLLMFSTIGFAKEEARYLRVNGNVSLQSKRNDRIIKVAVPGLRSFKEDVKFSETKLDVSKKWLVRDAVLDRLGTFEIGSGEERKNYNSTLRIKFTETFEKDNREKPLYTLITVFLDDDVIAQSTAQSNSISTGGTLSILPAFAAKFGIEGEQLEITISYQQIK